MSRRHLFTGRRSQLALMSEFLIRQMNVAIPEVDLDDDVIVVRENNDVITRVQVKASIAKLRRDVNHFSAQFRIPLQQLNNGPEHLVYALVVRCNQRWEEFLLIRRSILFDLHRLHQIGSEDQLQNFILPLSFRPDSIMNKGVNLQPFRYCFEPWPPSDIIPAGVVPINAV